MAENKYKLIGFGDSWAHGSSDCDKTYLQLVAERLSLPWSNYAVPSSSIPHLVLQFQQFLENEYCRDQKYLAVFFLTAQERTFFINPLDKTIIHSSPCKVEIINNPIEKYFYQNYTDEYGVFMFNTSLLALQQMCSINNILDIYIPGWQTPVLWNSINLEKCLFSGQHPVTKLFGQTTSFTDLMNSNCSLLAKSGHPNQQGHQIIADSLISHINRTLP
jgi:hypothetical protein